MFQKTMVRQGSRDARKEMISHTEHAVRPGVLLVRWSPGPAPRGLLTTEAHVPGPDRMKDIEDRLGYLRANHGLKNVVPVFGERRRAAPQPASVPSGEARAVVRSLTSIEDDRTRGLTVLHLDPKADLGAIAKQLRGRGVDFVEPSPNRWPSARKAALDPRISAQWGLQAIDWFGARRPDASHIGVAIVDSGIDRGHPDLKAAVASYEHGSFGSADALGHGTHVAGIIAAVINNRIGIAGVSNARLHCWKIFGGRTGEDYDDVAYLQALGAVAKDPSIKVLNLSLGGTEKSRAESDLLAMLLDRGVLVVAAMGNEYQEGNPKEYPAAYDSVMAIGAVGLARKRSAFSNTGPHISMVAPGESVLSTLPRQKGPGRSDTDYAAWDGTSMATPFVAGAAALVFARFPKYGPQQTRQRLESKALKLGTKKERPAKEYGSGLLNLKKAL
jgi:hypothetical protein